MNNSYELHKSNTREHGIQCFFFTEYEYKSTFQNKLVWQKSTTIL